MKKSLLMIVVISIVVGIVFYFKIRNESVISFSYELSQKISVHEIINTGSPNRSLSYSVSENATALELLQKTSKISIQGEGRNAYVTEINGKKAISSNKEFWAFYVNGKLADVGAGSYQLHSNDIIEWKIEKY